MGLFDPVKQAVASHLAKSKSDELREGLKRQTPEMRQASYDAGRRSILGDFADEEPGVIAACAASAKAARRKERLTLVSQGIVACPDHGESAARLRQDMDEVENMRCARHVYAEPKDKLGDAPPGFHLASPQELARLGLDKDDLRPPGTPGFKAAVYVKDKSVWGEHPDPEAVLAFRGSTPEREDWENNFAQGMNLDAPYYRNAVSLGTQLASTGSKVQIVGHSLGGGLASAAQGASGLPCSTYNAAGLNSGTVQRYLTELHVDTPPADPSTINAIRVKGEVLTKTQEEGVTGMLAADAVGKKRDLDPALTPDQLEQQKKAGLVDPEEDYATHLHGMDMVIDAMEQQKRADEAALRQCLRKAA
jgi:hypothetical protein